MKTLSNPRSFVHVREHSLGGAVHSRDHDEHDGIDFDDPRYFSQAASPPKPSRARGGAIERDRDGHRIYSEG
jgi:hypothetical protein